MVPLYCYLSFLLIVYFCREHCCAIDTISTTQLLRDPEYVESTNGTYKLGFFSPKDSTNRYVGIWFNRIPEQTVVWVANRNKPIRDSSGVLKISENGNLQLINGQNLIIWSSNVSNITIRNTTAQLLDSGNLVLLQSNSTGEPEKLWQSFDHPTDTFLPHMNPTVPDTLNRKNMIFRSWSSLSDPSEGSMSTGIGTTGGVPQVFTWNNEISFWRSGPWDGNNWIGLPNVDNTLKDGFVLKKNTGTVGMSFDPDPTVLFNYVVLPNGTIIERYWDHTTNIWVSGWVAPSTECELYGKCGPYGSCDHNSGKCNCLRGFRPKNNQEWREGNSSSGCVRRKKVTCGTPGEKEDKFLKLPTMKVPDNVVQISAFSQDSCKTQCERNCSCLAYAYHLNIGCMIWTKDLIDTQEFSAGGVDLFLRLAASELEESKSHKRTAIIASVTIIGAIAAVIFIYFLRRRMMQRETREKRDRNSNRYNFEVNQLDLQEPPLYTYDMLRNATNNFDANNKLGEGGFGPVYKGKLENGQVIAVKRLSASSGQGLEEFVTEVKVISKLQHRNLVKLLGC